MDFNFEVLAAALALLLWTAILFESSVQPVFSWRYWQRYGEGRGLKVPLLFAWAYLIVSTVHFDALTWAFSADPSAVGQVVTALTIMGGAGRVLKIMQRIEATKRGDLSAPADPAPYTNGVAKGGAV